MNADQGSQYTGAGWITTLTKADIKISMDGRGRYLDEYLHRTAVAVTEAGGRLSA
jgi:hypothetical protein